MRSFLTILFFAFLISFSCQTKKEVFLAQGIMSGEATDNSILLQSRLTATDTLVSGDISGVSGQGRFEVSENENFAPSKFTEWIQADSLYDFIIKCKVADLKAGARYFYRLHYGRNPNDLNVSKTGSFKTNYGKDKPLD